MKIPEPLFALINPVVRLLLVSPLHPVASASLMLVRFNGRKTGRMYVIPIRYIRKSNRVLCFTSRSNGWWRNMREPCPVNLRIECRDKHCTMRAIATETETIKEALMDLLRQYPQDAPYYDIQMKSDGTPEHSSVERAVLNTILLDAA